MMICALDSQDLSCAAAYLAQRWQSEAKASFSISLLILP